MRRQRISFRDAIGDAFNNPILAGTLTILVVTVAVYLSYIAQNGLPFIPTYQVSAEVHNGDELVKDADVRIGGALVGLVESITPEPATPGQPQPYARVTMSVNKSLEPLPANSHVEIRLLSVLGGKYVEVEPGNSRRGIPDGGTIPLANELPVVDLDQVFRTFNPGTIRGIRSSVASLGDGLAGRGTALNDSLYNLNGALPALTRVLDTLASPGTDLAGFIDGAAAVTDALEPVTPALSSLLGDAATTFAALNRAGPELASVLDELPGTESAASTDLTDSEPALLDAQKLVTALGPTASLLPSALRQVNGIAVAATPVFERAPGLIGPLNATLAAVDRLARDPDSTAAFKIIGDNDLASFSASGFVGLGAILKAAEAGQFNCNLEVPWLLNFSSALSEGDSTGAWLRTFEVLDPNELISSGTISPTLHDNYYPTENSTDCSAGNEPYGSGRVLGNPPGHYFGIEQTAPPPGVTARAQRAGLISNGGPS